MFFRNLTFFRFPAETADYLRLLATMPPEDSLGGDTLDEAP